ncbi:MULTISPECIES: hypothetical protein [unclassified Providencia]|uniref:hypothetical protein n=1 Tax=Providencia TaxID=586 RepID=UPI00234BBC08|nr:MULTISPECIES: hypothetical protein [unclassified Providencia]
MSPIKLFLVCLLAFSSASIASDNAGGKPEKKAGIPLDVKQYSEVGKFDVANPTSLSVVKFNGKTYVLSKMPDRRLYGLELNVDKQGREVLCGKLGASLKMTNCYYIYFREK